MSDARQSTVEIGEPIIDQETEERICRERVVPVTGGLPYATDLAKASKAIDIWSFGIMLAELFMLRTPFVGKTEGLQLVEYLRGLGPYKDKELKEMMLRVED